MEGQGFSMKRIAILLIMIAGLYIVFNQLLQFDGFAFGGSKEGRSALSKSIDTLRNKCGWRSNHDYSRRPK